MRKMEAGKLGSWEVKKCLWHGMSFLVLSALRHLQEKMEGMSFTCQSVMITSSHPETMKLKKSL